MNGEVISQIGAEGWVAIIGAISAGICAVFGTAFAFLKWFIPFYYKQRKDAMITQVKRDEKSKNEYKGLFESSLAREEKWQAQLDKQDAEIDSLRSEYRGEVKELKKENEKCRTEQQELRRELTKIKYKHDRLAVRWRAMLKAGRGATIIARADGTIIKASPEITAILHWVPDELEGENILILIPKRLRRYHEAAVAKVIEAGGESSDIRRVDSLAVRKEDIDKDEAHAREVPVTILVNWFRAENGYGPYLMCADIYPRLPLDDDLHDPGKTHEGPMKGLNTLPEEQQ